MQTTEREHEFSPELPSNEPLIILLTGPTGAGKTTIRDALHNTHLDMRYMPSQTTRDIRKDRNGIPIEIPGQDYHFITEEAFKQKIDDNLFFEYNLSYGGASYGTLLESFDPFLKNRKTLTKTMDMAGAFNYKSNVIEKFDPGTASYILDRSILIFIGVSHPLPLRKRFLERDTGNSDPEKRIQAREKFRNRLRQDWQDWIKYGYAFEHIIENEDGEEGFLRSFNLVTELIENKRSKLSQEAI